MRDRAQQFAKSPDKSNAVLVDGEQPGTETFPERPIHTRHSLTYALFDGRIGGHGG
jgi:hypothetical protein